MKACAAAKANQLRVELILVSHHITRTRSGFSSLEVFFSMQKGIQPLSFLTSLGNNHLIMAEFIMWGLVCLNWFEKKFTLQTKHICVNH